MPLDSIWSQNADSRSGREGRLSRFLTSMKLTTAIEVAHFAISDPTGVLTNDDSVNFKGRNLTLASF